MKFTFKKRPRSHGLASIGEGTPPTDIKLGGVEVGYISTDDSWHGERTGKFAVWLQTNASEAALARNQNCPWMWVRVKQLFDSEPEAREYIKANERGIYALLYDGFKQ